MNAQSVRNKMDLVQYYAINENCDLLVLAETWLNESETQLYELQGYNAVHSCRIDRGGGVSIYVKDTINYRKVAKANINDRVSWVCVAIGEQKLKVSGIYKPLSYDNNTFLLLLKSLFVKHQKRHIIVGDFNINLLENTNVVVNYKNLVSVYNFAIKIDIQV